MTKLLLSVHVLAAIIAIGPVTAAASMFTAAVRANAWASVAVFHRICRVYAVVGVTVPVFGLATANTMGVLGDAWLIVSMALTAAAAAVLGALILPRQGALLAAAEAAPGGESAPPAAPPRPALARLAMYTGVFNLLWATVTVLMIVRPGSTTGA
ncbi:DUF2269 family protein [Streptomyces paludis]|uniref:DUF2269 family protein n=1 Tax=Streptomyces paludis TaxID=2282738 RepID=A0A345HMP5_9ACTN|nr:DUF2269 family protein [Streptomyces paludis]AXG77969.1 DUF2269 family protein [Streptomyces paludis]